MCESVSLCVCVWQPEVEPHVINVTDRREHRYAPQECLHFRLFNHRIHFIKAIFYGAGPEKIGLIKAVHVKEALMMKRNLNIELALNCKKLGNKTPTQSACLVCRLC